MSEKNSKLVMDAAQAIVIYASRKGVLLNEFSVAEIINDKIGAASLSKLLRQSECYCHELMNNYVAKFGKGDHTKDIVEHITELKAALAALEPKEQQSK